MGEGQQLSVSVDVTADLVQALLSFERKGGHTAAVDSCEARLSLSAAVIRCISLVAESEQVCLAFEKKSHNAEKTEREDPLGFFNIHSVAKLQQLKGDPFVGKFFLKSRTVPKKSKGGTFWSRPVLYVTRETFLVQFLGPTGTFRGLLNFVELLVELFWSVQVVSKKH